MNDWTYKWPEGSPKVGDTRARGAQRRYPPPLPSSDPMVRAMLRAEAADAKKAERFPGGEQFDRTALKGQE